MSQLKYSSGGGRYRGEEPPPGKLVLRAYNRILAHEVRAQKHGLAAVEARARSDLGMIKEGETFYLVEPESR